MRFVFDTSVLIDYLREDDMAANALLRAAEIGSVFITLLSFMELWLPHKYPFRIRCGQKIQRIVQELDAGNVVDELLKEFHSNDYELAGHPSVEVRSPGRKWRIEWDQEQFYVRLNNDELSIFPRQKSKAEIQNEIDRLYELCEKIPAIQVIPCSAPSQGWTLKLLEHHCSALGRNALIDSMLIATGITRRAWLVTRDKQWSRIAQANKRQKLFPGLRIISPEQLVQRF